MNHEEILFANRLYVCKIGEFIQEVWVQTQSCKTKNLTIQTQPPKTLTTNAGLGIEVLDHLSSHEWLGCVLRTANAGRRQDNIEHRQESDTDRWERNHTHGIIKSTFFVEHRLQVAWNNCCKYKHILLNKSSQVSPNARRRAQCKGGGGKEKNKNNILIRFAAEIIYAVVSPAMFFGLATLPLTKNCLQKPGVVQRQMLRSI